MHTYGRVETHTLTRLCLAASLTHRQLSAYCCLTDTDTNSEKIMYQHDEYRLSSDKN